MLVVCVRWRFRVIVCGCVWNWGMLLGCLEMVWCKFCKWFWRCLMVLFVLRFGLIV